MNLAELRCHRVGGACHRFGVRHIQWQRDCSHTEGGDLLTGMFQHTRLDVGQRNMRTGSRQRPTDAKPDGVRRAND
jgi:hypothetical protein